MTNCLKGFTKKGKLFSSCEWTAEDGHQASLHATLAAVSNVSLLCDFNWVCLKIWVMCLAWITHTVLIYYGRLLC